MSIEMQALDAMFDDDADAVREILDALDADSLDTLAEVAHALGVLADDMAWEQRTGRKVSDALWYPMVVLRWMLVGTVLVLAGFGAACGMGWW